MLSFYGTQFSTVEINHSFYRMPTENLLLNWAKSVPVIAVSASATPPERERALRTGCDDFLPKPYYPEQMRAMLDKHLARVARVTR